MSPRGSRGASQRSKRADAAGRARRTNTVEGRTDATRCVRRATSAHPAATAVLSLGPDGLRLEPSRALDVSVDWADLTDTERIDRLRDEVRRASEALNAERAALASLWREYDALTRGEWHCSRATAIRAEMRAVLGSYP